MQYMPIAGLITSLFAMQTQEKNQLSEAGQPILLSQLSLYIIPQRHSMQTTGFDNTNFSLYS